MAEALIALGGNVGDVRATPSTARWRCCATEVPCGSPRARPTIATPPWGVEDQPPFVNLCIAVETTLTPQALLARAQAVERAFGRDRATERRWGPRPLDIDLLAYDDIALDEPDLTLPHPRLFERAFVLVPLAEIAPDRVIAGTRVRDALAGARHQRHREAAGAVAFLGHSVHGTFSAMTRAPDHLPLAAEFPAATHEQWRKLVDGVLKGAPFDRTLVARTYDGIANRARFSACSADAHPIVGRAPGAAWAVMQRVDHPDPAAANAEALHDLANGATGLTFVCAGSVSANGYGLDASAETLARVLDGVVLDAGIAIDFNLSPPTRNVVRHFAALVKAATSRRRRSICARASIRSAGLPPPAKARSPGRNSRKASPRSSASLPATAFAGRSRSPTGGSSTMRAAPRRRNWRSRSRARSPTCAHSRLAAFRSMPRAA